MRFGESYSLIAKKLLRNYIKFLKKLVYAIDIQEYRSLMSSSLYRRVSAQFENSNLAKVLATDIQYTGVKELRQVSLYSVQMFGGLFTNIADRL